MGNRYLLSHVNDAVWWTSNPSQQKTTRTISNSSGGKTKPMSLSKKYKRRLTRLMRLFSTIDIEHYPHWFISLTFDKKVHRNWSMARRQACFEKLKKHLSKVYPRCWFIYVWDYSPKADVHLHLFGSFGQKKAWRKVQAKWLAITGSSKKKMAHRVRFNKATFGYQLSPKKFKHKMHLTKSLGRKSLWGIINKKHMRLAKIRTVQLNYDELNSFSTSLEHTILLEKGSQASEREHIWKDSGCCYFVGKKSIKAALKYVRAVREVSS